MSIIDKIRKDKIMKSLMIRNKLPYLILMMIIWKEINKLIKIDILGNCIKIIIIRNTTIYKLILCLNLFHLLIILII